MTHPQALVIDDDDDARWIVTHYFRQLQVPCQALASAADVHVFLTNATWVDLILVDLHLPQQDGYQLLDLIRSTPSVAAAHVVAFTASVLPTDIAKAQQAGFDGFLSKPLHPTTVMDQFQHLLARRPLWPAQHPAFCHTPTPAQQATPPDGLDYQRRVYQREIGPHLDWMQERWQEASTSPHALLWASILQQQVHKHMGTAASLGFADFAHALRTVDQCLQAMLQHEKVLEAESAELVARLATLRQHADHLAHAPLRWHAPYNQNDDTLS